MAAQLDTYRFPKEFVGPSSGNSLRFNNRKAVPIHRLPFVGREPERVGYSFWRVPKTGGYFGGYETGEALATIYLKHLRDHGDLNNTHLQSIVFDMFGCEDSEDDGSSSRKGQAAGFLHTLGAWLTASAKQLGCNLDSAANTKLVQRANSGLRFDSKAYMASLVNSSDDQE